ncbi:MAG: YdcF family protein [Anaerolineae bacterium]|nr:YdcF family protein [Anaerolineae bacterium]
MFNSRHRIPRRLRYLILAGLGVSSWTIWTLSTRFDAQIHTTPEQLPARPVAIVFGAGYWPSGALSDILRDRLAAAATLYQTGRVQKILVSGDNHVLEYNEPEKMLAYLLEQGIPRSDIVLDYAGRRTYDTCYRARDIFLVDRVVLITQRYHLPRALYTCQTLGLEAEGYMADRVPYIHLRRYQWREVPALWRAWWDLHVAKTVPILGEPLPIFATKFCEISP